MLSFRTIEVEKLPGNPDLYFQVQAIGNEAATIACETKNPNGTFVSVRRQALAALNDDLSQRVRTPRTWSG